MKKTNTHKMTLKKLTIARISTKGMIHIKGGENNEKSSLSSNFSDEFYDSHIKCEDSNPF